MDAFPHTYRTSAESESSALEVVLTSHGLEDLVIAPPVEFDGPGDHWSPETLLTAAVTSCFNLTFKAIARASKLEWVRLRSSVEADLTRDHSGLRFTAMRLSVQLEIPQTQDPESARRLLEKAERSCLITSSLSAESTLDAEVVVVTEQHHAASAQTG